MGFHSVNMDLNTTQLFILCGLCVCVCIQVFHLSVIVCILLFCASHETVFVWILIGAAVDHSMRPTPARGSTLWANNTALGPAGRPVRQPQCAVGLAGRSSPLSDPWPRPELMSTGQLNWGRTAAELYSGFHMMTFVLITVTTWRR